MDAAITRLIEALSDSNRCLGEAAIRLEEHGETALRDDLLKQVATNATLIREVQP